ncbi:MAG: DUF2318 domain-containing protein [Chloroflexi bacterium]|nr:DUF2318 domain-containing protein [Chloroflexota bacterium]
MSKNGRTAKLGMSIAAVALLAVVGLVVVSCGSSGSGGPSGRIRPVLLTATVQGDSLSVPLNRVQGATNTRFVVSTPSGQESFMAYVYKGQTYVRASICVPCGGQSYSLQGNNLVCDTCGTVFDAATGKGKSGVPACQTYGKASAPFQVVDGNIVMKNADLLAAFQRTLDRS